MANKESIQNFKLKTETKAEFKSACEENNTTPSHELRQFVHEYLKQNNK